MYYPKNDFLSTGYFNPTEIPCDVGYYHARENISNVNIPKVSYAFNNNLFVDQKELPRVILYIDETPEDQYDDNLTIYNIPEEWNIKRFTPRKQYRFIFRHFPEHIETYRKIKDKTNKTRYFICLYLYVNGGIYINNKYTPRKSLDNLFTKDVDMYFMTGDTHNKNVRISWDFLASRPLCPFWLTLLPHIIEGKSNTTNFSLLSYTYHIGKIQEYLDPQPSDKMITFCDDAVNTATEVINYQIFLIIVIFILLFAIFIFASI